MRLLGCVVVCGYTILHRKCAGPTNSLQSFTAVEPLAIVFSYAVGKRGMLAAAAIHVIH